MKKTFPTLLLNAIIVFLISCTKKNIEIHPQLDRISIYDESKLKTLKEIPHTLLSFDILKSSFIDFSIQGGKFHNQQLFLYNTNAIRLDAFDTELNKKFSIGKRGKGPGELTEILDYAFSNDSLYVSDASFRLISYSLHDPKNHSERVLKEKIVTLTYFNDRLLTGQFSMTDSSIPLVKSIHDSSVKIGRTYNHEYNILNIFMNSFKIIHTQDYLVLFFYHSPDIYLFSKEFELIKLLHIPNLRTQTYEYDLIVGSITQVMPNKGVDGIVTISNSNGNKLYVTIGHGEIKKRQDVKSFYTLEIDCDFETFTKTNLTSNFIHLDSTKDMIFAFDPDTYQLISARKK